MQRSRYKYSPISRRDPLQFPNGKRVAILIYINVQHFPQGIPEYVHALVPALSDSQPDLLNTAWRDYGLRVGVWRLFEILQRHNIRATANLNLDVCTEYPEVIEQGNNQSWNWVAVSQHGSQHLAGMTESQERSHIQSIITGIEKGTGKRPKGWSTPGFAESFQTPDILAESGFEYVCDYACDDQPFPLDVKTGSLISIPYSIEINDMAAFLSIGVSGTEFGKMIRDQFDVLYREGETNGRVLPICLHTFLLGQAFRAKHLEEALEYICSHEDVWFTTADELNEWYRKSSL